jgi:type II secretory pathway component PulF
MIAPAPQDDPEYARSTGLHGGEDLVETVADVATAGLPLASGLHAYSQEAPSHRMRAALRRLSHDLDAGKSLDAALAEQERLVPAYLRGLIAAGARTGRFGEVVEQHLLCLRRSRDVRTRVRLALAYPFLLLIGATLLMFLMLVWPVPMFREIFEDFGIALPWPTRLVLWLSDGAGVLLRYWPYVLVGLAGAIALVFLLRYVPGRPTRVRILQWIPFIGMALRYVGLSEFCSLLSILIECRVPLPAALRLTADAVNDPNLAEGGRRLADEIEEGARPDDAVKGLPHFPRSVATMFRWSGREGALAQGLRAAGELFAMQARMQSGVVGVIVQPFLFFALAGGMGAVLASLYLPLFGLLDMLAI